MSVEEPKSGEPDACAPGGTSEGVASGSFPDTPCEQAARAAEKAAFAGEDMTRRDGLRSKPTHPTCEKAEREATSPQCAESPVMAEGVSVTSVSPGSTEQEENVGLPDASMDTNTFEVKRVRCRAHDLHVL